MPSLCTVSNLEGTYEDLAVWFTDILKNGDKKNIDATDIISFLNTKNRVPKSILKKNNKITDFCSVMVTRNKETRKCKNKAEIGSEICKFHKIKNSTDKIDKTDKKIKKKKKPIVTLKKLRDLDKRSLDEMLDFWITKHGDSLVGEIDDIINNLPNKKSRLNAVRKLDHKESVDLYKLLVVIDEKKYEITEDSENYDSDESEESE
jgi:hypothetical protein